MSNTVVNVDDIISCIYDNNIDESFKLFIKDTFEGYFSFFSISCFHIIISLKIRRLINYIKQYFAI